MPTPPLADGVVRAAEAAGAAHVDRSTTTLVGGAAVLLVLLAFQIGRKLATRSRAGAAHRFAALERVGEEIAWECDADGRFTFASRQCLDLLGYTPAQVRSLTLFDVVHPDQHAVVVLLLAGRQGWWRRPFHCVAEDGSDVWLRSSAEVRRDRDGRVTGLTGASYPWEAAPAGRTTRPAPSGAVLGLLRDGAVRTAFQPLVSLRSGRVLGVEALTRFGPAHAHRSTQEWFDVAAEAGLAVDLEVHAVRRALAAAADLPDSLSVSVNLSPEALLWPGLPPVLTDGPVPPERLVVEITEHAPVVDYERLAGALRPLRERGVRLAVDDAGAGYASFRHILLLTPDVIKLDRALVAGIDEDPARRALAAAVVGFARDVRADVVAEGIEHTGELAAAVDLGVTAGQGYLLGHPTADPAAWAAWAPAARRAGG